MKLTCLKYFFWLGWIAFIIGGFFLFFPLSIAAQSPFDDNSIFSPNNECTVIGTANTGRSCDPSSSRIYCPLDTVAGLCCETLAQCAAYQRQYLDCVLETTCITPYPVQCNENAPGCCVSEDECTELETFLTQGVDIDAFNSKIEDQIEANQNSLTTQQILQDSDYSICRQVRASDSVETDLRDECSRCLDTGGIWTAFGCVSVRPGQMMQALLAIGISLSGGVALLLLLSASFMLTVSQGDPKRITQGREILTSSVVGLLFILFSITMLEFIGFKIFNIPGLNEVEQYLAELNPLQYSQNFDSSANPGSVVSVFLGTIAFPLAGLILFLMLLWGGFEVLVQSPSKKNITAGRQRITAAIIGFILLFASYWIVQIIDLVFGTSIL